MPRDRSIYSFRINDFAQNTGWDTRNLFDLNHTDLDISPIDTFIKKNKELNRLIFDPNSLSQEIIRLKNVGDIGESTKSSLLTYISTPSNINPVLANLILLGHISAVESYFRELIRKIILIDDESQKSCESKMIAYGAAIVHNNQMLPEALLENVSFASKQNIKEALKDFLGVKNIPFPNNVDEALDEFSSVCQLRHCVVHRFGKLGVNNAIQLGLEIHKECIEKPIVLDYNSLNKVSLICTNIVKEINNFLWQVIMMRLISDFSQNFKPKNAIVWKWDFRKDKKKFRSYYNVFFSIEHPPSNTSINDAFIQYEKKYNDLF